MNTHILACEGHIYCSNGHANGWDLLILLGVLVGGVIALLIVGLVLHAAGWEPKPPKPPKAPHDGRRYTYPVRAVTPGGTAVAMKCCRAGHRTADQAKAHAGLVAERVRMTGR